MMDMYSKMLVPLDSSHLAERVIPYAAEFAWRMDLQVDVLHVFASRHEQDAAVHWAYAERAGETLRRQLDAFRTGRGTSAPVATQQVRSSVAVGHPAHEILRYAGENAIDLLLMATHGHSGVNRWAVGSVAARVLRAARSPVLLIPTGIDSQISFDEWPSRRILVPLDGSALSEAALPHADTLARQWPGDPVQIVLIRVCEPIFVTADYPEGNMPLSWDQHVSDMKSRFEQLAGRYLSDVARAARKRGHDAQWRILTGRTPEAIIECASEDPYTIIVMSTHGRSGMGRWAYGSIAHKVVQASSCPVFLTRPH